MYGNQETYTMNHRFSRFMSKLLGVRSFDSTQLKGDVQAVIPLMDADSPEAFLGRDEFIAQGSESILGGVAQQPSIWLINNAPGCLGFVRSITIGMPATGSTVSIGITNLATNGPFPPSTLPNSWGFTDTRLLRQDAFLPQPRPNLRVASNSQGLAAIVMTLYRILLPASSVTVLPLNVVLGEQFAIVAQTETSNIVLSAAYRWSERVANRNEVTF